MADIEIIPVYSRAPLRRFLTLPWSIYRGDRNWVPPLLMDQKKTLARSFPFFDRGSGQLFLARRGGVDIGRISAQFSENHLEKYRDGRGFFGWFECIDDPAAAAALLNAARCWLRERRRELSHLRGPFQWDINGENTGILIEDQRPGPPVALMSYNPAYYPKLLESAGLTKAVDLYAWLAEQSAEFTGGAQARLERVADAVRKRVPNLALRAIDTGSGYRRDMELVRGLFNTAWADNWGATPLSAREMDVIAASLKMIARPGLTRLVFHGEVPAGCMVCVPNINEILPAVNGRLFPFGWLTLLRGLKHIRGMRTMLMGVAREFRGKGLELLMITEIIRDAQAMGMVYSELSWVLETNDAMNSLAAKLGQRYRTYRVYEGEL